MARLQVKKKPKRAQAKKKVVWSTKKAKRVTRPLKKVALKDAQVAKLAAYGLTDVEIADVLGVARSTLHARFRAVLKKGRAELACGLKRTQVELALAGNVTMLVWLGKQYLAQKDQQAIIRDPDGPEPVSRETKAHIAKIMRDDVARDAYNKLCDRLGAMDDQATALVRGGVGGNGKGRAGGNGEDGD